MNGLTLDTGALIALERRRQRVMGFVTLAQRAGARVTAPANVIAEWWRKRTNRAEEILEVLVVEAMDEDLAKRVGETLAAVKGAGLVDATVIVGAAERGDVVLTGDVDDFARLQQRFPTVRLLAV